MVNVLLVDNYDSFTLNIRQLLNSIGCSVRTIKNDELQWSVVEEEILPQIEFVVLSPGPGRPDHVKDFGISDHFFDTNIPVLGICLGHQGLACHFGAKLHVASHIIHGRQSSVFHNGDSIFQGLPSPVQFVRYNSLLITPESLPEELRLLAWSKGQDTEEMEVMAIEHLQKCFVGVQFHPESILSECGSELLRNWLKKAYRWNLAYRPGLGCRSIATSDRDPSTPAASIADSPWHVRSTPCSWCEPQDFVADLLQRSEYFVWLDSGHSAGQEQRISYVGTPSKCFSLFLSFDEHDTLHFTCGKRIEHLVKRGMSRFNPIYRSQNDKLTATCKNVRYFDAMTELSKELHVESLDYPAIMGAFGYGLRRETLPPYRRLTNAGRRGKCRLDAAMIFTDRCYAFDHDQQMLTRHDLAFKSQCGQDISFHKSFDAAPFDWAFGQRHDEKRWSFRDCSQQADLKDPRRVPYGLEKTQVIKSVEEQRDSYLSKISSCLSNIRHGETYEMNLTTQFRFRGADTSPPATSFSQRCFNMFCKQRKANPATYAGLFIWSSTALLCSSPEKFLQIEGSDNQDGDHTRIITMRPMKGTRPRCKNSQADEESRTELENSVKDRAENLMIVDLVRHELNDISDGVQVIKLMEVESHSHVHQLTSTIKGRLRSDVPWSDAIKAAFPPGSMTGAPKVRTVQLLDEIEAIERGMYSGAFGFAGRKTMFNVIIRSAVVDIDDFHDNGAVSCSVGAGGALTILSQPQEEWEETLLKALTVVADEK